MDLEKCELSWIEWSMRQAQQKASQLEMALTAAGDGQSQLLQACKDHLVNPATSTL